MRKRRVHSLRQVGDRWDRLNAEALSKPLDPKSAVAFWVERRKFPVGFYEQGLLGRQPSHRALFHVVAIPLDLIQVVAQKAKNHSGTLDRVG